MYYISKRFEISGAHRLDLDYQSKCQNLHGHNWIITVYCKSRELNSNGMVYDFAHVKSKITEKLDHRFLNDIFDFNPTAENIAHWICEELGERCYKVSVQESEGNIAIYERDE